MLFDDLCATGRSEERETGVSVLHLHQCQPDPCHRLGGELIHSPHTNMLSTQLPQLVRDFIEEIKQQPQCTKLTQTSRV